MNVPTTDRPPRRPRAIAAAALSLCLAGCYLGSMYEPDRSYVLYDPSVPPPRDSAARQAADPLGDPAAAAPTEGLDPAVVESVERIFTLEAARDALERAIVDGVGDPAALQAKIVDLEREIGWRQDEVGAVYDRLRAARLARIRSMPTVSR